MSSIEIKRKMMKLYRGDILKKVYSTLLKLVTKTRIEEEGEEGEGIRIVIQNRDYSESQRINKASI